MRCPLVVPRASAGRGRSAPLTLPLGGRLGRSATGPVFGCAVVAERCVAVRGSSSPLRPSLAPCAVPTGPLWVGSPTVALARGKRLPVPRRPACGPTSAPPCGGGLWAVRAAARPCAACISSGLIVGTCSGTMASDCTSSASRVGALGRRRRCCHHSPQPSPTSTTLASTRLAGRALAKRACTLDQAFESPTPTRPAAPALVLHL